MRTCKTCGNRLKSKQKMYCSHACTNPDRGDRIRKAYYIKLNKAKAWDLYYHTSNDYEKMHMRKLLEIAEKGRLKNE